MNKNNINKITYLQIIGVSLVVLGHSLPTLNRPLYGTLLFDFIYSFHMPLFIAVSGYLFYFSDPYKIGYLNFIKKKFIQLAVPYFVISTIAYFPKVLLSKYALRPIEFGLDSYIESMLFTDKNPIIFFWFLPTIFIIFLISPLLKKALDSKNKTIFSLVTIMLILVNQLNPFSGNTFLSIGLVPHYLLFFWIGSLIFIYEDKLDKILKLKYITLILLFLILTSIIFIKQSLLVVMITNIIGVFMSFSLVCNLKISEQSQLNLIKKYSYQIYLLSWFPQTALGVILGKINIYPLTIIVMFFGGLILPIIVSMFISKFIPKLNIVIGMKNN